MSTEPKTEEERAWDEWFDKQYDLCDQVDRAIKGLSEGKTDGFRAALWAGLIEHGAEKMRQYVLLAQPEPEHSPTCNGMMMGFGGPMDCNGSCK